MKFSLTILAVLLSVSIYAQIKPVNFNDCKVDRMFVSAETEPKWNCDSVGMIDFMNKYLNDKELSHVNQGRIIVGILIYEDGKTCCKSFFNLASSALSSEAIKDAVNRMPNWIPALQNGKPITFLKQHVFLIKDGKFVAN